MMNLIEGGDLMPSAARVAEEAGVGLRTVFRHFDDMDSLYNVVKSFTGWGGFDTNLRFWEPPTVLNTVTALVSRICWVRAAAAARIIVGAESRNSLR